MSLHSPSVVWPYEKQPVPKLPVDIIDASPYLIRGRLNRLFYYEDGMSRSANDYTKTELEEMNGYRRSLWAMLTDEQKATWYWYAYIEEHNVRSPGDRTNYTRIRDGGFIRIHAYGSSGLASVIPYADGYAITGLCCYSRDGARWQEQNTISNLLAVRTNLREFESTGCTNTPAEQVRNSYQRWNENRVRRDNPRLYALVRESWGR